jgi:hypothetical protein
MYRHRRRAYTRTTSTGNWTAMRTEHQSARDIDRVMLRGAPTGRANGHPTTSGMNATICDVACHLRARELARAVYRSVLAACGGRGKEMCLEIALNTGIETLNVAVPRCNDTDNACLLDQHLQRSAADSREIMNTLNAITQAPTPITVAMADWLIYSLLLFLLWLIVLSLLDSFMHMRRTACRRILRTWECRSNLT